MHNEKNAIHNPSLTKQKTRAAIESYISKSPEGKVSLNGLVKFLIDQGEFEEQSNIKNLLLLKIRDNINALRVCILIGKYADKISVDVKRETKAILLIKFFIPLDLQEVLSGDLLEGYESQVESLGPRFATIWIWKEAIFCVGNFALDYLIAKFAKLKSLSK